jgi:hypothetical protein
MSNVETQTEWSWIQDLQFIERIKKGKQIIKQIISLGEYLHEC